MRALEGANQCVVEWMGLPCFTAEPKSASHHAPAMSRKMLSACGWDEIEQMASCCIKCPSDDGAWHITAVKGCNLTVLDRTTAYELCAVQSPGHGVMNHQG